MPTAYSYIRFSSEKQARGDSMRRQSDLAKHYIEANPQLGLELDSTLKLTDEGLSAYKGIAQNKGSLGAFFRLVEDGKIAKGSYLLVESLDRLSRQTPRLALVQLNMLIEEGIVVVTLSDGKAYTKEVLDSDGGMSLIFAIMLMSRAYEESLIKGQRVSLAWRQKMIRVADGVQLTRKVPFWISKEDRSKVIPERVSVVERIFELSAEGYGGQRITAQLNSERLLPPTSKASKWGVSSVKKVLNSEAVIGILTTADGVRHENYYPKVITEKLWIKTRFQGITSKQTRDRNEVHPLSGLCVCSECGGTAHRSGKTGRIRRDGTRNLWRTLVCANSLGNRSSCQYQSISYDKIVRAVLEALRNYQYSPPTDDIGGQLWALGHAISNVADEISDLKDDLKRNRSSAMLKQRLTASMVELDSLNSEQARLRALARPLTVKEVEEGIEALLVDSRLENKYFKQVVRRIAIDFTQRSLVITGHDGTTLQAEIEDSIDVTNAL